LLFDVVFKQFLQNDDSDQKKLEEKLSELRKNLSEIKIKSKRLLSVITQNDHLANLSAISEELTEYDAI
jgi:cell shape-determining protein MreC